MIDMKQVNFEDLFEYTVLPEDMTDLQNVGTNSLKAFLGSRFSQGILYGCRVTVVDESTIEISTGLILFPDFSLSFIREAIQLQIEDISSLEDRVILIEARKELVDDRKGYNEAGIEVVVTKKVSSIPYAVEVQSEGSILLAAIRIPAESLAIESGMIDSSLSVRNQSVPQNDYLEIQILNDIPILKELDELKMTPYFQEISYSGYFTRKTSTACKVAKISLTTLYNEVTEEWVPFVDIRGEANHGVTFSFNQSSKKWSYKTTNMAGAGHECVLKLTPSLIWRA